MGKLITVIVALMLSGCMVGPNYQRPFIDIPMEFHFENPKAENTLNLDWWTQFNDPVLESLIIEALAYNKEVQIAAANIVDAIGILIQTRAPLFPQIGYNTFYNRYRTSETLATTEDFPIPNPQTTWQAIIEGSWDLDVWGRTRRLVESAQAEIYASYEARQQVILALVASVANSYIQLLGLDEQLRISIRTRDSYELAVKYFELQLDHGQASQMAVAQAKTQYELAAAQIPAVKAQIVQTENALNVLLGRNPGPIPRGKDIYTLNLPAVPASLPSELLCQRPDIRKAEQDLIAANAQIGAAKALYFPTISLTGFYGGASQELNKLFSGPSKTWSFTGSIVGPIFTGGAIYGQVLQAKAITQAAAIRYSQVIQNAFAEVEDALFTNEMLVIQLGAQERLVQAAGDYQRLSTLQYQGGYAPYFIVIQAQQQYFPAQLSLAQTRAQLFISLVNIYQTMGGGWVNIAESISDSICD